MQFDSNKGNFDSRPTIVYLYINRNTRQPLPAHRYIYREKEPSGKQRSLSQKKWISNIPRPAPTCSLSIISWPDIPTDNSCESNLRLYSSSLPVAALASLSGSADAVLASMLFSFSTSSLTLTLAGCSFASSWPTPPVSWLLPSAIVPA